MKAGRYVTRALEGSEEYGENEAGLILLLHVTICDEKLCLGLSFKPDDIQASCDILRLMGWRGHDLANLSGIGDRWIAIDVDDDGSPTVNVESTLKTQAAMPAVAVTKIKWIVYATDPLDFWDGLEPCPLSDVPADAVHAVRLAGWEGDIREGPFRFYLPDPGSCQTLKAYGWKQDNNGECFFASPVPLPHLGKPFAPAAVAQPQPTEAIKQRLLRTGRSKCESPIEVQFFDSMMTQLNLPTEDGSFGTIDGWHFFVQYEYDRFRLDFMLTQKAGRAGLAIELDGHDFHERTKDQAQRDKSRDRKLTADGFRVVRFTGSEVFRDVRRCVNEVLGMCRA